MYRCLCTGGPALKIFQNNAKSSSTQRLIRILPDAPGGLKQAGIYVLFYWMDTFNSNFERIDSVLGTLNGDFYAIQAKETTALQMAFKRFAVGCCLRRHRKACEQAFTDD